MDTLGQTLTQQLSIFEGGLSTQFKVDVPPFHAMGAQLGCFGAHPEYLHPSSPGHLEAQSDQFIGYDFMGALQTAQKAKL